ncbi:unnamed protein product [Lathyrus sativus]|nr:unnamed protein product [Lathyrus sativus]
MKIKVENEKALKVNPTNQGSNPINTNVGNIQKLDHRKKLKVEVSKKMVEPSKVFVPNSNIRSQSEVEISNKVAQPSKVHVLNSNKRQMEVEATKEITEPRKVLALNNNTKKKLNSMVDQQVKGSIESQVSKNTSDQTKKILQSLNNTMNKSQQPFEKKKGLLKCPTMPLTECLDKNKEKVGVEEFDDEDTEENEMEEYMENDSIHNVKEVEGTDVNKAEGNTLGTSSSRLTKKRGKTLCRKIHGRQFKDRQEITLNEEGQPIGPDEKTVSELSSFLGTLGRSSDLCPLTFTSWIDLVKHWEEHNLDPVWDYVNEKYNIPKEGKKAVFAITNDAWRRYKCSLKRKHFSKYKTLREQLKNRPQEVPEEDFRKLLEYWRDDKTLEVSHQNAENVAQLKWRHRMGNKGFAVIREKMRENNEDKEPPTQAEMFIATRQSRKGKELDQETNHAIIKLQDLIENHGKPSSEAFENVFGKQKPGRLRCHGRTTTPTLLKRNEEIAKIKREHAAEIRQFNDKLQEMEEKHRQDKEETDRKIQVLLKTVLNQNTSELNIEALAALISTPATDANSVLRSSTSTHAPTNDQVMNDNINEAFEFEDEET